MHRKPSILLLPLLLATLLLRGLTPAGWMPVFGAEGIMMTVCVGDGAVRVDTGHAPGHPSAPESPCAFGAVAPLLPDALPLPGLLLIAIAVTVVALRPSFSRLPHRQYRPPGQGPPILQTA